MAKTTRQVVTQYVLDTRNAEAALQKIRVQLTSGEKQILDTHATYG